MTEASAAVSGSPDRGLVSLLIVSRFLGVAADADRLRREFGRPGQAFEATQLLRAARSLGFKARCVRSRWERLGVIALPALAQMRDGGWSVLAKADAGAVLVQDPAAPRPSVVPRQAFEPAWTGDLILMTRRGGTGSRQLPIYVVLSIVSRPFIRSRLSDKFNRGADTQAFLVESVTGIHTIKALAAEPEMQRRWEEHLAGYVRAGFRSVALTNVAGQVASLTQKVTTIAIVWTGAQLVIDGNLTIGQLVAFNMLAARVSSPVLRLVQVWQDFSKRGSRSSDWATC